MPPCADFFDYFYHIFPLTPEQGEKINAIREPLRRDRCYGRIYTFA